MPRRRRKSSSQSLRDVDWVSALAPPGQGWRLPLDALMLGLLLFAAFSYGATEPWSQQIVALLAVVSAVYVLVMCSLRSVACQPVGSWTYIPIVVFLGLVVLQTVPLPAGIVGLIAGGNLETRQTLLADLAGAVEAQGATPISLLPAATWRLLWALLPVVAIFVVFIHAYRTEAGVRRCCELLAIAGGAVALYAVYQYVARAPLDFGDGVKQSGHSGPFINHSHFGQFVNLGLGGAVGVLLMRVSRLFKVKTSAKRVWRELCRDRKQAVAWIAAALVVLGALVVPMSMTRGGTIAMLVAGGIVGALMVLFSGSSSGRGSDKAAILLSLGLVSVVALLVFGFDQVYARLASVSDVEQAQGGRLQILSDLWPAFMDYPWLGTGLGTFEFVYPLHDTGKLTALTTHAENEYAQLMLETGLVGMACVVVFLLVVLAAAWRVVRRAQRSLDYAAFGLSFGLLAILLHSASDFGQHMPAVALMTAVITASLLNLAALHRARPDDDDATLPQSAALLPQIETTAATIGPRPLRWLGPVVLGVLVVGSGWGILQLDGPRQARTHFARGEHLRARIYGPDPELIRPGDDEQLIKQYAAAAQADPAVPMYAYQRDYFSWGMIEFDDDGQPNDLSEDSPARADAVALLEQINAQRIAAPTFGPSHRLAGEILFFGLKDQDRGAALVALGQKLTPHDPYAAFTAGYIAARRGEDDRAMTQFRHATELSAGLRRDVVDVYINEFDRADLAYALAKENLSALQQLARLLAEDDFADAELVEKTQADIFRILTQRAYADHPRPADLVAMARVQKKRGDTDEALAFYRRAVALAPTQVGWRLELARFYAELGDPHEAVREARACLQLRPLMKGATKLLDEQVVLLGNITKPEPRS